MVVERPSPQIVGREFVRQYYTLLNEAPAHLHRFYNQTSWFIHGGLDPQNRDTINVVGQREIHQRIQQLNFRDCHAKISRVDSQTTLGNGVVVQVTGELSNNGQPMRRFTQTFVLAFQSPKKYYVRNDIFRYQDVLTDDENEGDNVRNDVDQDQENEMTQNEIHQSEMHNKTDVGYYTPAPTINGNVEPKIIEDYVVPVPAAQVIPPEPTDVPQPMPMNSHDVVSPQPTPAVVGDRLISSQVALNSKSPVALKTPQENNGTVQPAPYINQVESKQPSGDHEPQPFVSQHPPQPQPTSPAQMDNEPKTYATLVKSGTPQSNNLGPPATYGSTFSSPPSMPNTSQPQQQTSVQPATSPPLSEKHVEPSQNYSPKPQRTDNTRNNFTSSQRTGSDDNGNYNSGGYDGDRRRSTQYHDKAYPDNQQLFIGNLPHSATEDELRSVFGKFGNILDLKILSKHQPPNMKGLSSKVPNYGFVTFEDADSVQKALNAKPIMFPDGSNMTLNVEEKKPRRGGEGGRPGGPRGNIMGSGPPRGGGPSRPSGRGSGPMRPSFRR